MAATLNTAPTTPAYNSDDIFIEIETDLVDTAAEGYVDIVSQEPGEPAIGEELTLTWGGTEVVLTVAATTNSTATAIPTRLIGETMDEYAQRWAEALRENGTISDAFHITTHSVGRIRLTYKTDGVIDITVVENLTSTEFTVSDGTDPNTAANLAAVVQIWTPSGFLSLPDTLITTLHGTYGSDTATTEFNLSELFPVKPHLPNPAHIDPGIFTSWLRGEATDSFTEYYLRYADKYGTPAVPEALVKSDSYHVLHGARSDGRDIVNTISLYGNMLHNYRRSEGGSFWKPIGDGQPDWLYFWVIQDLFNCNVEWTILWDDGTETVEPYGGSAFDLDANKAYYIRSTPLNFDFTPTNPGAIPWYITFRLFGYIDEGDPITFATIRYKASIQTEWERWLLFDNGVGGCEAVLFNGKGKEGYNGKREAARRVRTSSFDIDEGEIATFNPEGNQTFELNTGWIEKWYADHLRQLLLGDVWEVDFAGERFKKLICETDSVETSVSDQQLHALSVKFRTSWVDKASNV